MVMPNSSSPSWAPCLACMSARTRQQCRQGVLTAARARLQCTIWVFCSNGDCGGLSQGACLLKTSNGSIINQGSSGAPHDVRTLSQVETLHAHVEFATLKPATDHLKGSSMHPVENGMPSCWTGGMSALPAPFC